MAFKWADYFPGSVSKSFSPDEIKKSKYGEYFDHLQKNLEKYADDLDLYRSAIDIISMELGDDQLEEFLSSLISKIPYFGFEFRRLILDLNSPDGSKKRVIGEISKESHYEYLDSQVISLLKDNSRVFINDTKRVRFLKFIEGNDIPKTVLGYKLDGFKESSGVLWFANPDEILLSKDQVDSLDLIISAVTRSLNNAIKTFESNQEVQLFSSIFDQYPDPCFIYLENSIIHQNDASISIFKDDDGKIEFSQEIIRAVENGRTHIDLGTVNYRIFFSSTLLGESEYLFVILSDEKNISLQRKYLHLVIQTLSLTNETPLKNIIGYSKMIQLLGEIQNPQSEYLQRITSEAENSVNDLKNLLEISRLEQENPLVIKEISIDVLIDQLLEASRHLVKQKRINIEEHYKESKITLPVDEVLTSQAFYLILEYLLDRLSPGQKIGISTSQANDRIEIIFADNGGGISKIDLALLNQLDLKSNVDHRIKLAHDIMLFLGGALEIKSELGRGSEYIFSWPIDQPIPSK